MINLGCLFILIKNFEKAIEIFEMSLSLFEEEEEEEEEQEKEREKQETREKNQQEQLQFKLTIDHGNLAQRVNLFSLLKK